MPETVLNPEALGDAALKLKGAMTSQLIGQDECTSQVVKFTQQHHVGLSYPGRPPGVFFLLGPTGTGKTRLVEVFAEALHGEKNTLIRVDCAEFQDSHEVSKLIGAPPGYVGHTETEPMITKQRLQRKDNKPNVVLFDEFDKAHPALMKLLLGVLDKARLHTDKGDLDFSNTFIFLTSNIGTAEMEAAYNGSMGLTPIIHTVKSAAKEVRKRGIAALRKRYTPEFVNRLDSILVFNAFTREDVGRILDMELRSLQAAFVKHDDLTRFVFTMMPEARELILDKGYSVKENARNLKRALNTLFLQKISNLLASKQISDGDWLVISREGDTLGFKRTASGLDMAKMQEQVKRTCS